MIRDPSQPLKPKHELMAQAMAKGANATEACKKAGFCPKNADVTGPRMATNAPYGIGARVKWLQEQAVSDTVLSIREKREFLALIVRTSIGDIDETSPLCQSVKIGKEGEREYKMPDKLKAIERDDALAPEVEVKASEIVIRIGQ